MPQRSTLARLQQVLAMALAALSAAWFVAHWARSPFAAVGGAVAILYVHAFFLAVEFLLVRFVARNDPAPRASALELAWAWWRETLTAQRVFCWRQPFRWRAVPDRLTGEPGRRGVVLVHGFVCNRGFWTPWLERLAAGGHPFIAVNLEPVFGSIDDYAPIIEDAVGRLSAATGQPPLLVCHSMGGLAARAWLCRFDGWSRIHHLVTIGSPHHGTWLGRFSHLTNGRQMRQGSAWLEALARHATQSDFSRTTCWYSNCDNVVFPPSTATLPGADNRLVRGEAHVDLAFHAAVMDGTIDLLAKK